METLIRHVKQTKGDRFNLLVVFFFTGRHKWVYNEEYKDVVSQENKIERKVLTKSATKLWSLVGCRKIKKKYKYFKYS